MALREWITTANIQSRLGEKLMLRLYDSDGDGSLADETTDLTQLKTDATSYVAGFLRPIYTLAAVDAAVTAGTCNEVVRLTLDVAESYACRRWPEVARHRNWQEIIDRADTELKAIRRGDRRLDVDGTPEPAANVGGEWGQGDPSLFDSSDPPETFTVDGFGDF